MKNMFSQVRHQWAYPLATLGLLAAASTAQAQSPTVTRASLAPAANARAAARNTTVAVPFSQSIDPATAGGIRVFSQQYRGRRTTTATVSGSTVTLTPTVPATGSQVADFKPGETVFVTVPATVKSTANVAATKYVYQFTAAAAAGDGPFVDNSDPSVGANPRGIALGDVDGDGDLDFVTGSTGISAASVRINNGTGTFTAPTNTPNPATGGGGGNLALGDVDGDGDLDLLTSNYTDATVSVRLNNGAGVFTAPANTPNPSVGGNPGSISLGDLDGDGDLDFVTTNGSGTSSIGFNNGAGVFTPIGGPSVGSNAYGAALGDVDGDGDLDLLWSSYSANTVSVRLNNGTGAFTVPANTPNPSVSTNPVGLVLGDVDGDGDLDFVTVNLGNNTASVRLNNGTGVFTALAS